MGVRAVRENKKRERKLDENSRSGAGRNTQKGLWPGVMQFTVSFIPAQKAPGGGKGSGYSSPA